MECVITKQVFLVLLIGNFQNTCIFKNALGQEPLFIKQLRQDKINK